MNPYQEHAANMAEMQAILGGQNPGGDRTQGAVLTFDELQFSVPCTHSDIIEDWLLTSGKSPTSMILQCEFLVSDVPAQIPNSNPPIPLNLEKGIKCSLKPTPTDKSKKWRLWEGGKMSGAQ